MPTSLKTFSLLLLVCLALPAWAAQDQMYGLGGTTTGRVGSVVAEPDNAFASLLNPALLAASPRGKFAFSFGGVQARMDSPTGVLLDSRKYRTRDGDDRTGNATLPEVGTAVMSAGYSQPIPLKFWPAHRMGVGLSMSGPLGQFRRWVALSPYDFTMLRYGAADTQFKGTFSGSLEVIPNKLFIGGGVSLFMTSNGVTEASLTAENQTGRMAMDIAFNTSGIVGLYSVFDKFSAAVVWRQRVDPVLRQTFIGTAQMGAVDFANQPAAAQGSLYYEPAVVEFEMQQTFNKWVVSAGLGFQQWSQYKPRYLVVATRDANGTDRSTIPAIVPMHDTWNPRASVEWRGWNKWRISAGYQYRPTAVADLSQAGNLLDTDTHVTGLSFQRAMGDVLFFNSLSLGLYGQAHWMKDRDVVKTDTTFIGSPGYKISGRGLVFGAYLTSEL
jgi:long-subunit fatty acid transport protein